MTARHGGRGGTGEGLNSQALWIALYENTKLRSEKDSLGEQCYIHERRVAKDEAVLGPIGWVA